MSGLLAATEEFAPPSSRDFELPAIAAGITKPMTLVVFAAVLVAVFFYVTARRAQIVPGKLQFAGEGVYGFVRDGVAKDVIGPEFLRYVPYLVTLFSFILVNNVFGIVPIIQFPPMSRIAFPMVLAIITWGGWDTLEGAKPLQIGYIILYLLMAFFAFMTWVERRLIGRFQARLGPNRVGPYGLLQPIADLGKLFEQLAHQP